MSRNVGNTYMHKQRKQIQGRWMDTIFETVLHRTVEKISVGFFQKHNITEDAQGKLLEFDLVARKCVEIC